jgi:hypothetical protein
LESLGITKVVAMEQYHNPEDLFMDLLNKGVAFINMSGEHLQNAEVEYYKKFYDYNAAFLSKAKHIVVLGVGTAKTIFEELYATKFKLSSALIHPSGKNKEDARWQQVWTGTYLKDNFLVDKTVEALDKNILSKSEIEKHFYLNLPNASLYSNGPVERGVHGVELIEGEYYASHYHLKTKIAKEPLRAILSRMNGMELTRLAGLETDFHQWPKVKYVPDPYFIQKYKLSWLIKQFVKS